MFDAMYNYCTKEPITEASFSPLFFIEMKRSEQEIKHRPTKANKQMKDRYSILIKKKRSSVRARVQVVRNNILTRVSPLELCPLLHCFLAYKFYFGQFNLSFFRAVFCIYYSRQLRQCYIHYLLITLLSLIFLVSCQKMVEYKIKKFV